MGVSCATPICGITTIQRNNIIPTYRNRRERDGPLRLIKATNMEERCDKGRGMKHAGRKENMPFNGTVSCYDTVISLSSSPLQLSPGQQWESHRHTQLALTTTTAAATVSHRVLVIRPPQLSIGGAPMPFLPLLNTSPRSVNIDEEIKSAYSEGSLNRGVSTVMSFPKTPMKSTIITNTTPSNNEKDDGGAIQRGNPSPENISWKIEVETLVPPTTCNSVATTDAPDGTVLLGSETTYSERLTSDVECDNSVDAAHQVLTIEPLMEHVKSALTSCLQSRLLPYVLRALTLQTVAREVPSSLITSRLILGCHVDLKGEQPPIEEPIDLNLLRYAAPALLKYRIAAHWEECIVKALNAAKNTTEPKGSREETRASIVSSILRSSGYDDILFGAFIPSGVSRRMLTGGPLFVPKNLRVPTRTCCSSSGDRNPDDGRNINGTSESCSCKMITTVRTVGAASFEVIPSLFLAIGNAKRHAQQNVKNGRKVRRSEVRPMFPREFVATLASGSECVCTYVSTMLPEFLVGLKSFLNKPMQAVVSALRATMHLMFNAIAREVIRHGGLTCNRSRLSIRTPPVDLSVVYLRSDTIFYASTPGMQGVLFLFSDVKRRLCAIMESGGGDGGVAAAADASLRNPNKTAEDMPPRDDCRASPKSDAQLSQKVYDLPRIRRGALDLSKLHEESVMMSAMGAPPDTNKTTGQLMVAEGVLNPSFFSLEEVLGCSGTNALRRQQHHNDDNKHEEGTKEKSLPPHKELPTTDVVLPHVAVTAVSEFWCEMPLESIWELLWWMLLLDLDASKRTFPLQGVLDNATGTPAVETPHLAALRVSTDICPHTISCLEEFYKRRVFHHLFTDELKTSTPQEMMDETMRRIRLSYVAPNGSTKYAQTSEKLVSEESLGNAMAAFLASAVEKRLPVWRTCTKNAETKRRSSCSVMVVMVPPSTRAETHSPREGRLNLLP